MKILVFLFVAMPSLASASFLTEAAHRQAREFSNEMLVEQLNHHPFFWAYLTPRHVILQFKKRLKDPKKFVLLAPLLATEILDNGFRADYVKEVFDEMLSTTSLVPTGLTETEVQRLYQLTCEKLKSIEPCPLFKRNLMLKNFGQLEPDYLANVLLQSYEPLVNERTHLSIDLLSQYATIVVNQKNPSYDWFKIARVIRVLARMKEAGSEWLYFGVVKPARSEGPGLELLYLRDSALQKVVDKETPLTVARLFMAEILSDVAEIAERGPNIYFDTNELVLREDQFLLKVFAQYADDALVAEFETRVTQLAEKRTAQAWIRPVKTLRHAYNVAQPQSP